MEWTSTAIRVWSFPRRAIPDSILAGKPDVNDFGLPTANFEGDCDIDAHFFNHSLIFDIDFCGQWAGPTFHDAGCPALVADNVSHRHQTYLILHYDVLTTHRPGSLAIPLLDSTLPPSLTPTGKLTILTSTKQFQGLHQPQALHSRLWYRQSAPHP